MGARFVWLGGWPQGLGAAGGGAEFLNLYGQASGSAQGAFLALFWGQKGAEALGSGPAAASRAGARFWPFGLPFFGLFGQKSGVKLVILPRSLGTFFGAKNGRPSDDFSSFLAVLARPPKKVGFGPFLARPAFFVLVWGQLFGLLAKGRHRLDVSCFGPKSVGKFPLFGPKHDTSRLSAFFWS